jgi:hypothetical protein
MSPLGAVENTDESHDSAGHLPRTNFSATGRELALPEAPPGAKGIDGNKA